MLKESKILSRLMLGITLAMLLPTLNIAQQGKQRVVILKAYKDQPVEITAVRVKGVAIAPRRKFTVAGEWLNRMTITAKNVLDKPIAYFSVLVGAPYEKDGKRISAGIELKYGAAPAGPGEPSPPYRQPLLPGESVDMVLSESLRDELHSLLISENTSTDVAELSIRLYEVFFEGDSDTKWSTGTMLRRDPNDSRHWIPIEPSKPLSQTLRKLQIVPVRLTTPRRFIVPDEDIDKCTYKDLGTRDEDCNATDSYGLKCIWVNRLLSSTNYPRDLKSGHI